jgi:hypothetical protein
MAVLGRRQPFPPHILNPLRGAQPSAASLVIKAPVSQTASRRLSFHVQIINQIKPAGPSVAKLVVRSQNQSIEANRPRFRTQVTNQIKPAGPSLATMIVKSPGVRMAAYRPAFRTAVINQLKPSGPSVATLVVKSPGMLSASRRPVFSTRIINQIKPAGSSQAKVMVRSLISSARRPAFETRIINQIKPSGPSLATLKTSFQRFFGKPIAHVQIKSQFDKIPKTPVGKLVTKTFVSNFYPGKPKTKTRIINQFVNTHQPPQKPIGKLKVLSYVALSMNARPIYHPGFNLNNLFPPPPPPLPCPYIPGRPFDISTLPSRVGDGADDIRSKTGDSDSLPGRPTECR